MKQLTKLAYYLAASPTMLLGFFFVIWGKGFQQGENACYHLWTWVKSNDNHF